MNTKSIDFCAAALRAWIGEGANMPTKAELPKLAECVEELLFAYNTLRQRSETLSEVLIDAAAHGHFATLDETIDAAMKLRGGNGEAEQPGVATAPSEVYEAEPPHPDVHAEFVRWAHNYIDTKLYEGMKGPTDIEGHPV